MITRESYLYPNRSAPPGLTSPQVSPYLPANLWSVSWWRTCLKRFVNSSRQWRSPGWRDKKPSHWRAGEGEIRARTETWEAPSRTDSKQRAELGLTLRLGNHPSAVFLLTTTRRQQECKFVLFFPLTPGSCAPTAVLGMEIDSLKAPAALAWPVGR